MTYWSTHWLAWKGKHNTYRLMNQYRVRRWW